MTADNWEPSGDFEKALSELGWIVDLRIIKSLRPLLIAEARPQIEAEERERIAVQFDEWGKRDEAAWIRSLVLPLRALKDSKPSPLAPRYPAISITEEDLKDAST